MKFITYDQAADLEEIGLGGTGGWFEAGMRWEDYLTKWKPYTHKILERLRSEIIKNNIRCTGDQHQHGNYKSCPVFANGKTATYSYRAWGDLMAAIWSTEDDQDYSYMTFYM